MPSAPLPANEPERLKALRRYGVLDTAAEPAFDNLVELASRICDVPIALVSLVDSDRQWFKSRIGLDVSETHRDYAFCAHAILRPDEVLHIEDALLDPRFADNPLVTGPPHIRFYAGAPLITADDFALGTVCTIDVRPRRLSAGQVASLRALARVASLLLDDRLHARWESERVTETHRLEIERLVTIATQTLDLHVFIDRDLVFRSVNETYLRYWDVPREAVIGKRLDEIERDELSRSDELRPLLSRAFGGVSSTVRTLVSYPTMGPRHMEHAVLPARAESGTTIGAVVRSHDVTELVEKSEALSVTTKKLEDVVLTQQRFIHLLSHDLREPINTIMNFTDLLAEEHSASMSVEARDFLSRVCGAGRRMRALIDDLVELIRVDDHAWTPQPVDLGELVGELLLDLDDAIRRTGAEVMVGPLPIVRGERSLLRVLLQNVVANALKFTRPESPPRVRIDGVVSRETVEVRVADDGIGIPTEQLEKVFDVFHRLHTRKRYEGTGLGLAICRRIVELHGGKIWATSEPNAGASIHVLLSIAT